MEIMMPAIKRYYFASIYPDGQKQRQRVTCALASVVLAFDCVGSTHIQSAHETLKATSDTRERLE